MVIHIDVVQWQCTLYVNSKIELLSYPCVFNISTYNLYSKNNFLMI